MLFITVLNHVYTESKKRRTMDKEVLDKIKVEALVRTASMFLIIGVFIGCFVLWPFTIMIVIVAGLVCALFFAMFSSIYRMIRDDMILDYEIENMKVDKNV